MKDTYIAESASISNSTLGLRSKIYKNALVKGSLIGDNSIVGDNAIIDESEIGSCSSINRSNFIFRSKIGDYSYTGINTSARSAVIGSFCSLAWNVSIGGGNHSFDHVTTSPMWRFKMLDNENLEHKENKDLLKRLEEFGDCVIGNDVWLGTNSVVLRGVKVGNGAIIGAGAVVTRDVEPYAIVTGIPARMSRRRFDDYYIENLEKIQWWNWPKEIIRDNLDLIYATKVDKQVIESMLKIAGSL
ncbi:CatB-related O-acetyltransferase [Algoriphagus sp. NG3]|uniref:xenobiotic acyltransferase family protein n=1 Tax=Algoriphagus sp. NG3 TaxID=3097546 RepID=UPI002A831279|nr:CatB-related O-acetyltransferase [Algoriphagus sp. NG3]WPR77832.1 CatB-related O-acetyltransferase [Algoriphagus sp. NG3]